MSGAVASLVALLAAIVVSMVSRINVGLIAIAAAWVIGVYLVDMKADAVLAGFPSGLFLTRFGRALYPEHIEQKRSGHIRRPRLTWLQVEERENSPTSPLQNRLKRHRTLIGQCLRRLRTRSRRLPVSGFACARISMRIRPSPPLRELLRNSGPGTTSYQAQRVSIGTSSPVFHLSGVPTSESRE